MSEWTPWKQHGSFFGLELVKLKNSVHLNIFMEIAVEYLSWKRWACDVQSVEKEAVAWKILLLQQ